MTEKTGVTVMSKDQSSSNNNYFSEPLYSDGHAAAQQVATPMPQMTIADPAPLGMLAYGTVFLCSSLLTLGVGNVTTPNLVLVFATFYGGISQTIVGIWEMYMGNTFAATVFATYGGFNFSYGALYLPEIGLADAYASSGEFTHAIGIYLGIWCLITFVFFLGSFKTTAPIVFTLGSTVCALACLSANCFTPNPHLNTAGGALGICATAGAYYGALSGFYSPHTTFPFIRLPPVVLASSNV